VAAFRQAARYVEGRTAFVARGEHVCDDVCHAKSRDAGDLPVETRFPLTPLTGHIVVGQWSFDWTRHERLLVSAQKRRRRNSSYA
jgi:hypothetical protein